MRLTNEYVAPVSAPVYELRIEHASMASDRFVVGISGIEDRGEKFFMQVSDPFGYDGCRADSGVLFAPAIADERLRYSATFIGHMNACISSGGGEGIFRQSAV